MKILLLITCFSVILYGCGNEADTSAEKQQVQESTVAESKDHHHEESEAITLNDGQKWKVDDNMMRFFRQIESSVNAFQGSELSNYKVLSKEVTANLDSITANCTMKGQAHDELHKWLVPFLGDAEAFSKAEDKNEAAAYHKTIKDNFKTFNEYFE